MMGGLGVDQLGWCLHGHLFGDERAPVTALRGESGAQDR